MPRFDTAVREPASPRRCATLTLDTEQQPRETKRPYERTSTTSATSASEAPASSGPAKGMPANKAPAPLVDDGQARLRYRIRAIDFGKNTLGYDAYLQAVPK